MGLLSMLSFFILKLVLVTAWGFSLDDFLLPSRINKFEVFLIVLNLIIMLVRIIKRNHYSFASRAPLLYIFAGQGTQQLGMLDRLLQIPAARAQIDKYSSQLGLDLTSISRCQPELLNRTSITQPMLVLSQVLHFRYLHSVPLLPHDYLIGHSIGEYSALCIANSIDLGTCLNVVRRRGQLMEDCGRGGEGSGMMIVRYSDENRGRVEQVAGELGLQFACFNTLNNVNLAGRTKALEQTKTRFKQEKITALLLPVSAAFHCSLLNPIVAPYREFLSGVRFAQPQANIVRNIDSQVYQNEEDIREGLVRHLTSPVQFAGSVMTVGREVEFVEIGHNRIVSKFVHEIRKKML